MLVVFEITNACLLSGLWCGTVEEYGLDRAPSATTSPLQSRSANGLCQDGLDFHPALCACGTTNNTNNNGKGYNSNNNKYENSVNHRK